jgi:hypothetical protein
MMVAMLNLETRKLEDHEELEIALTKRVACGQIISAGYLT